MPGEDVSGGGTEVGLVEEPVPNGMEEVGIPEVELA